MHLNDLSFVDLFVGDSPQASWTKATTNSLVKELVPKELHEEVGDFYLALIKEHQDFKGRPFYFKWTRGSERSFRVTPIETIRQRPLFVCRSHVARPGTLQELNWPSTVCDYLMRQPVRDGLFLFMGSMGAGKTTSATSFVMGQVATFGGVAMTIEYPREMDLEGDHGHGSIYQTEIESEAHLGGALRGMLGSSANILYPSEIKSSDSANEVVNLSLTGHPVVTTLHAPNLADGLLRFSRLLDQRNDGLAGALKAAFHIHLVPPDPPGFRPKSAGLDQLNGDVSAKVVLHSLFMLSETKDAISSNIRSGNFGFLNNEIERQGRLFQAGKL